MPYSLRHTFLPNIPYYIMGSICTGVFLTILKKMHIITGGFPGMSLIIYALIDTLSVGGILFLLNIPPLIYGYFVKGKQFTIIVLLSMGMISVITDAIMWGLLPYLPDFSVSIGNMIFWVIVSSMMGGMGLSLFVNKHSNPGGLMIIIQAISEKTQLPIPLIMFIQDMLILLWGLSTILSWQGFFYSALSVTSLTSTMYIVRPFMVKNTP